MRTILHSDLNNFYASVELLKHPECKDLPVAVTGSIEDRHGIVLAKNQLAKSFGVKTGEVIWQAKSKCHNLITLPADFESYSRISKAVRAIYGRFTDHIEPFGIDECWLDVTDSLKLFGSGEQIAEQIRAAVKEEIGVTVSIGVSFNKIFAKLGSDMKKPDAVTLITPDNYREKVWVLPVEDLLYVGRATKRKLNTLGIHTIGDLAKTDKKIISDILGAWGRTLHCYANGLDDSPVSERMSGEVKSIGNSLTDYKDLYTFDEVKTLILLLAESVAARLRKSGVGRAWTVKLTVTDTELKTCGKQMTLECPTSSALDIANAAYDLFSSLYKWNNPVRGVGVSVCNFTQGAEQLLLGVDYEDINKKDKIDCAIDGIRKKYGNTSLQRARILQDKKLAGADIKGDNFTHDISGNKE